MKIGSFSGRGDYDSSKPIVFDISMPDNGQIVDANIVLGHKTAQLHLRVLYATDDVTAAFEMIAVMLGQEHDDLLRSEFVMRTRTAKFTSEVQPYYLFTAPRGE